MQPTDSAICTPYTIILPLHHFVLLIKIRLLFPYSFFSLFKNKIKLHASRCKISTNLPFYPCKYEKNARNVTRGLERLEAKKPPRIGRSWKIYRGREEISISIDRLRRKTSSGGVDKQRRLFLPSRHAPRPRLPRSVFVRQYPLGRERIIY